MRMTFKHFIHLLFYGLICFAQIVLIAGGWNYYLLKLQSMFSLFNGLDIKWIGPILGVGLTINSFFLYDLIMRNSKRGQ